MNRSCSHLSVKARVVSFSGLSHASHRATLSGGSKGRSERLSAQAREAVASSAHAPSSSYPALVYGPSPAVQKKTSSATASVNAGVPGGLQRGDPRAFDARAIYAFFAHVTTWRARQSTGVSAKELLRGLDGLTRRLRPPEEASARSWRPSGSKRGRHCRARGTQRLKVHSADRAAVPGCRGDLNGKKARRELMNKARGAQTPPDEPGASAAALEC